MVEIENDSIINTEPIIDELIRLYKKEFNIELIHKKAREEFYKLCLLYKLIYIEK